MGIKWDYWKQSFSITKVCACTTSRCIIFKLEFLHKMSLKMVCQKYAVLALIRIQCPWFLFFFTGKMHDFRKPTGGGNTNCPNFV